MERDSVDYYRARARAECEAALNASCEEARHAHAEMAEAYRLLAELHELRQRGALPPDKVTSVSERLHERADSEYGRPHTGSADAPGTSVKL
jgi:predicted anti-sigma-YlaC factor YlaD